MQAIAAPVLPGPGCLSVTLSEWMHAVALPSSFSHDSLQMTDRCADSAYMRPLIERGTVAAGKDAKETQMILNHKAAMAHIPYLQPFVDVNKRTSRLAANIPLIRRNLVPLSFLDLPERTYMEGLIGIYELNRVELLRDVYVWAYERSVRQYKTVRDSLPEPDPFRLRYRAQIIEVVADIVRQRTPQTRDAIANLAHPIVDARDVPRFTQLVLQEVAELHEGNIARFRLSMIAAPPCYTAPIARPEGK